MAGLRASLSLLAVALIALIVAPAALAQSSESEADAVLVLQVDGSRMTVSLDDIEVTVGALELDITGLPSLDGECTIAEGVIGACQQTDGVLRFVALNPTGWDQTVELATMDFSDTITDAMAPNLGLIADVQGDEIVGDVAFDAPLPAESSSSFPWLVVVGAIVLVGLGLMVALLRRNSGTNDASSEDL